MLWIEIFIILILAHLISDWFFQPSIWAIRKIENWKPRLYHSIQYTIIFIPFFYFLKIDFLWLIYLLITHFIIDSYKIVEFWNKILVIGTNKKKPKWFQIVQDQIIHVLLLIPIALFPD